MRRRAFIAALGGAAAMPLVASAQQATRARRVGVLFDVVGDDQAWRDRLAAFRQELERLGWIDGQNIQIDVRSADGDPGRLRSFAAELAASGPDVILAAGSPSLSALLQVTRTVPTVFAVVVDPVGSGFVSNLARPGGHITGFTPFEYGLSSKWLELLKEIVPSVTRAAVLRDPANPSGIGQFAAIRAMGPSLGVELTPIDIRSAGEIERGLAAFVRSPNGGLIVTSAGSVVHRKMIIASAARLSLPAVYALRSFVTDGGLVSYGPDLIDGFRRASGYVDRILKGEKPGDLPVQASDKFDLAINLKTAKTLGLTVPPTLLARADEVIE